MVDDIVKSQLLNKSFSAQNKPITLQYDVMTCHFWAKKPGLIWEEKKICQFWRKLSTVFTRMFKFLVDLTRKGKHSLKHGETNVFENWRRLPSLKARSGKKFCPICLQEKSEMTNVMKLQMPLYSMEWVRVGELNKTRLNMKAWLSCSAYARWTRYCLYGQAFCAQRSQRH